jgi:hypothetical protein
MDNPSSNLSEEDLLKLVDSPISAFLLTGLQSCRKKRPKLEPEAEAEIGLVQRMASARKYFGKVMTTQELAQEMELRSKSALEDEIKEPPSNFITSNEVSESKETFLESQPESQSTPSLPLVRDLETVEDVLKQLPPIDVSKILAEIEAEMAEEEDFEMEGLIPAMPKPKTDTSPEALKELHDGSKECLNGNFDEEDGEFREWSEVVSKRSKDGQLLRVLPYCVID